MTFIDAAVKEARELGRQEGLMTAKSLILRGVADTRYEGGGVSAWEKACDRMHTFINGLKSVHFVNLENSTVLNNEDDKAEAYMAAAKALVELAPHLAQQLADRFAAHAKKSGE